MTVISYSRGHEVVWNRSRLTYASDGMPVDKDRDRPCPRCGKPPLRCEICVAYGVADPRHDACLGHIPGCISACCGHGVHEPILIMEEVTR